MGRRRRHRGPYLDDGEPRLTVRGTVRRARLKRLEADARVRDIALIADRFHLDPVLVAGELDELKRDLRIACHNVAVEEQERAEARAAAAAKTRRRR